MVAELGHLFDFCSTAATGKLKGHQAVVIGGGPEVGRLHAVCAVSVTVTADTLRRVHPIAEKLCHCGGHAAGNRSLAGRGIVRAIVVVAWRLVPMGLDQRGDDNTPISGGCVVFGSQCPPGGGHSLIGEGGRRHRSTYFSNILGKPLLQLDRCLLYVEIALGGIPQHRCDAVIGTDNHITLTYIVNVQAVDGVAGIIRQNFIGLDQKRVGTSGVLHTCPFPVKIGSHPLTGQGVHRGRYQ